MSSRGCLRGACHLSWLLFLLPAHAAAQGGANLTDSVSIIPGPDYAAGAFHRFFWGDHYRNAWTTEIRVPVLDLREFAGGLTPLSAGGGFQTKSLWLTGADGKIYAFRSTYKNAAPLVPAVLRNTYVEELFQDQMSTQYPFAPLLVAPLLHAAGVLSPEPYLYVLPDGPALGEFRADFGGVLGALAERPDENESEMAAFLGAAEVIDGFDVVERVMSDPSHRVHARSFLTARMVDILVGDWDRHADQWRWADFGPDSTPAWRPIPADRDQAFARLDGMILGLGRRRFPMLTSFGNEYDHVSRYHYQARFIDRLFLTELERSVWDSTAAILTARLTDDVIDEAVARLPTEVRSSDGPFFESALASRREQLPRIASEMYELLAREPYVHASDAPDVAEVIEAAGGVEIVIRQAAGSSEPYFRRTFRAGETKEIRLYLHAGDDRVVIRGEGALPIRVNIVGGEGDDEFQFASSTGNVHLYDQHGSNRVVGTASGIGINGRSYPEPTLVPESGTAPPPRHWGRFAYPVASTGFNPDIGFLVGASYTWFDYGFRKDPHASRATLSGAVTTRLKGMLQFDGDFRFENSPLLVGIDASGSSLETVHFFGVGNDTKLITDPSSDFYDVENTRIEGEFSLRSDWGRILDVGIGVTAGFSNTKDDPNTFLGQNPVYGVGQFGLVGAVLRLDLATRKPGVLIETANRPRASLRIRSQFYPKLIDVVDAYGTLDVVGTTALPLGVRRWELGLRAAGKKIWGDAPWFQLAFIGGDNSLRGWAAERFAGDASLYGSAELRLDLFDYNIIFPSTFGILGLADAGRVWVDGDSPGGWHTGYGGGIWLALRGTRSIVSAAYAESDENKGLYITVGFSF